MNKVFINFDIDWASDSLVNEIIDMCLAYEVKATFFATHKSMTLSRLRNNKNFEIGLHPNFLPGSTQGGTEEEVLGYCRSLEPNAVSIRSHCVYQYGKIYNLFNQILGDNLVESNIFMPGVPTINPFLLYTKNGFLVRVPFFWSDDYYLLGKKILCPKVLLDSDGVKVYMFHPVHIYHNTVSMEHYECIKKGEDYTVPPGKGIRDIFISLLEKISDDNIETGLMKEFLNFSKE